MGLFKLIPTMALVGGGVMNHHAVEQQFDKIFDIARVTSVQMEVSDIAKMVYLDSLENSDPKDQAHFEEYVRKNMQTKVGQTRDTSKDFWGTPYRLQRLPTEIKISSAGPDKSFDTEDDIVTGYHL